MNGTLPLFDDLPPGKPRARQRKASGRAAQVSADATARAGGSAPGARAPAGAGDRHLRAAWRLSRSMWRYRDHSPEQTRAGLAICHHLQALLSDAGSAGGEKSGE